MTDTKGDIRLIYIRDDNGQRRGVVAYRVNPDSRVAALGASFCADTDRFDRDRGVAMAVKRMMNLPACRNVAGLRARDVGRAVMTAAVAGRCGFRSPVDPSWVGSSQTARTLVKRMLKKR